MINILEVGSIIKDKEMDNSGGLMAINTWENGMMIKEMDMVKKYGKMATNMRATG